MTKVQQISFGANPQIKMVNVPKCIENNLNNFSQITLPHGINLTITRNQPNAYLPREDLYGVIATKKYKNSNPLKHSADCLLVDKNIEEASLLEKITTAVNKVVNNIVKSEPKSENKPNIFKRILNFFSL